MFFIIFHKIILVTIGTMVEVTQCFHNQWGLIWLRLPFILKQNSNIKAILVNRSYPIKVIKESYSFYFREHRF